jgi:hypothetical protein
VRDEADPSDGHRGVAAQGETHLNAKLFISHSLGLFAVALFAGTKPGTSGSRVMTFCVKPFSNF